MMTPARDGVCFPLRDRLSYKPLGVISAATTVKIEPCVLGRSARKDYGARRNLSIARGVGLGWGPCTVEID